MSAAASDAEPMQEDGGPAGDSPPPPPASDSAVPAAAAAPRRRPPGRLGPTAEQAEVQGMVVDELAIRVRQQFQQFLEDYQDATNNNAYYYVDQLKDMEENESTTLVINWSHLVPEDMNAAIGTYQDLAAMIQAEFYRFEPYLRQAVQNFVRSKNPNYVQNTDTNGEEDKEFFISIINFTDLSALRDLKTSKVGQLCSVSGTVTRTTEVRPELVYGTFTCGECGSVEKYIAQQFKYTEPQICTNSQCQNKKVWELDVERSKFVDWQKARVQENSHDIPPGSMPRSLDIVLRNESVERCKPGDQSTFTGTLIVVPDVAQYYSRGPTMIRNQAPAGPSEGVTGLKALGVRELNYKMVFLANSVTASHKQFGQTDIRDEADQQDVMQTLTREEQEEIAKISEMPKLYERMANSIAPNIYGHEEIKRGILLMLFGGVHKKCKDLTKLRGDINICVIGDPSTAKSQFLKYVTRMLPRTVYTSGKASTAAGLTAAVMRDPETGEFGVEAGALMLADNGICCIDEFDKMDGLDQAAIHEAMEQQTITITKAGIQATLNARASILAAANPMWGRYDTSKPLRYNVNISPPIMSRFDLFYVILDECDETTDYHVASHIVKMHQTGRQDAVTCDFTADQIQRYIRVARTIKPKITQSARKLLVRFYRQLRQRDQSEQKAYRFTVRQLESLIRLSEALARVHFDQNVGDRYVKEAARLLKQSIISVDHGDIDLEGPELEKQPTPAEATTTAATGDEQSTVEAGGATGAVAGGAAPQSVTCNFNYYIQTANLIVYHIRRQEIEDGAGVKQSEIERIVMEERADDIEGAEEFEKEHKILLFIIHRLIETDHVLLIKRDSDTPADRVLIVHPNYDPDSRNMDNLEEERAQQTGVSESPDVDTADADAQNDENEDTSNAQNGADKKGRKRLRRAAAQPPAAAADEVRDAMDYE